MDTKLIEITKTSGLEITKAETILKSFNDFFEQAKGWETKAKGIVITDISQVEEMKEARKARLALKDIRVNSEKVRKELKEQSLREGKAIDGIANVIKALVVPIEEYLENQEKFVERIEEEKKEKLNSERIVKLSPYVQDVSMFNLKDMSEAGFNELYNSSKTAFDARKEAERKAEEERLINEKLEKEKQEQMRVENERLKKEAEARERVIAEERAKAEIERKKKEEEHRKEAEARAKAEKALQDKKNEEERIKREADAKVEADKQLKAKLEKEGKYNAFLKENGYTEETKGSFKIYKEGNQIQLFKKLATFNI